MRLAPTLALGGAGPAPAVSQEPEQGTGLPGSLRGQAHAKGDDIPPPGLIT